MRPHRRAAIALLLAGFSALGREALAQGASSAREPRRVAILFSGGRENYYNDFTAELHARGYVQERTIRLFPRWAQGDVSRLPGMAAEIIEWKPEVIVTSSTAATNAIKRTGTKIPVVMATSADPVRSGFVASLERPGGNITGNASLPVSLNIKTLELLHKVVPKAKRIGVLLTRTSAYDAQMPDVLEAAKAMGVELVTVRANSEAELEQVFASLRQEGIQALLVFGDAVFVVHRRKLAALAAKAKMPAIYQWKSHAEAGGLLSYGPQISQSWKIAARFVDRILKGADPATLPVDEAKIFELVVNTMTARALGITIPKSVTSRADLRLG